MKKSSRLITLCFISLAMLSTIVACKTKDESPDPVIPAPEKAIMQIKMTDGAGPYEQVMINIQEVKIHLDGTGWVSLPMTRPGFYNLPDFTNGTDTLIATGPLTVGKISQLRLVLGPGNYLVKSGTTYGMATPSAEESGLKINIDQTLLPNMTYVLWVDFDAEKSIVEQGNGSYSLKPVLRGYFKSTAGAAYGFVDPPSEADAVYAVNSHTPNDTFRTYTRVDGYFKLVGLPAALYDFTFTKAGSTVKVVQSVSIGINAETNVGTVSIP